MRRVAQPVLWRRAALHLRRADAPRITREAPAILEAGVAVARHVDGLPFRLPHWDRWAAPREVVALAELIVAVLCAVIVLAAVVAAPAQVV